MFEDHPPASGKHRYKAGVPGDPVASENTDRLIRQVFQLSDSVDAGLEREWQKVCGAEFISWGDQILIFESCVRRFMSRQPDFWKIHDAIDTVHSLKSQGAHCPAKVMEQAEASLAELCKRVSKKVT